MTFIGWVERGFDFLGHPISTSLQRARLLLCLEWVPAIVEWST
jgi:hypothetical protein